MNILQRFLRAVRSQTWLTHPRDPVIASWFGGGATASGVSVDPAQAERLAAVGACVRVIAESVGSLPLVLYKRDGKAKVPDEAHPLYRVLHDQPNEVQTSVEFWEMMARHMLMRGNAYAFIESSRREPVKSLIPLHPDRMQPFRVADGTVAYRYTTEKGGQHTYLQEEILHIRDLSDDGIVGLSRIDQAREAIGLGMAQEEFASRFFGNNATIGATIEHPAKLSPEAYDRLKKEIAERRGGLTNAHKPAILEEGMKWTAIGIAPEQAQFIESRKLQKDEIAMIFRVPPHMIASLDRATFSNIEHQSVEFVTFTLRPILTRIEKAIYRDLLTTAGKETHFVKFNTMALLRGDSAARATYYKAGLGTTQQPGWLTPNEVRELEDMNPIDGGDALTPLITTMKAPADAPQDEPKDDETVTVNKASYRVTVPIQIDMPDRVVRKTITPTYDAGGDMLHADVVEIETAQ